MMIEKKFNNSKKLSEGEFFEEKFFYKNDTFLRKIGRGNFFKRDEIESFIKEQFFKAYAAEIEVTYPILVGIKNEKGEIIAALGVREAESEKLFLENYLNKPLIDYFSAFFGKEVTRNKIAEVGNFATTGSSGIRSLITSCISLLRDLGCDYIAFTGTENLRRYFSALGLKPVVIADAKPSKVVNSNVWGSYYDSNPKVVIGDISNQNLQLNCRFDSHAIVTHADSKPISIAA